KWPPFAYLVVVDQVLVRVLGPCTWRLVEVVREDADGRGNGDVLGIEEAQLVLPVKPGRGDRGVRQPVESYVVEDVIAGEAAGLPGEGAGNELVAPRVVIDHPGSKAHWRVGDSVDRLRLRAHLDGIADALRVEVIQLLVSLPFFRGQAFWPGAGREHVERLGDLGRYGASHVGVHAEQLGRRLHGHEIRDDRAPVAALGDEL